MIAGVFVFGLNCCCKGLHHLQRYAFCLLFAFFNFNFLTVQFHILKVSEGSDDIDKKQDDHADADKQSGYAGNEINRNRFYRDTYDGCQQPQKKKPV